MKEHIILNNLKFNDTKELRKYINEQIRNCYKINSQISPEHTVFIKELIRFKYSERFVNSITSITVKSCRLYGKEQKTLFAHSRHFKPQPLKISNSVSEAGLFFLKKIKSSQESIYNRELRRKKQTALRATVYDQISKVKNDYKKQYPNFDFSDYEVDHVDPEFQVIVDNWLKSKRLNWEDLEIYCTSPGMFQLSNKELAKDFHQYHKKVANLAYIPKEKHYNKHLCKKNCLY